MRILYRVLPLAFAALIVALLFPAPASVQTPATPPMSSLEKEADGVFRAGDWAKTAVAYEAVAKAEPQNGRAHLRFGVSNLNLGNNEAAAKSLELAVSMNFNPVQANYSLARALARLNHKTEALLALQTAVQAGYGNLQQLQANEDFASLRSDAKFAALVTQMQRALRPCEFDDNYKAFDFWLGDWYVIPAGTPANTPPSALQQNHIEKIVNGCAILETWTPNSNGSGKSLNIYNAATRKWEQLWADSSGRAIHFLGEVRDGNMHFTSDSVNAQGQRVLGKMTFFNKPPDSIHQVWQTSTDGGQTWTTGFDATYMRKK